MSARLSEFTTTGIAHQHAADQDAVWSILPDAMPVADEPLLTAREVLGATLALLIATVLALFVLG